ncbi:ParB/RepB/Spo0J family partition protein [Desulfitobacterium hafniense]|uniref:ParB/RepB/Spo0J family partition protein n=1 Tax=Desulfitobacterium hafniense TaxID=49338 RepID=UPI00035F27D2|nr:ParB/RepB/Spo0J family partition protein [Desulfitobacterium hafniense]
MAIPENRRKVRSLDDLFGPAEPVKDSPPEAGGIVELELSALIPFKAHPFKLYTGERLDNMVESIRENGVIQPIVVRPIDGAKYEILAGHNRVNASRIAGLTTIKSLILEGISDHEARLIVTISNLEQRSYSDMSPSELAKSLKMQLEAAKATGKKQDLINALKSASNPHEDWDSESVVPVGPQEHSHQKVAEKNKMSPTNIKRYIRLNELIPDLMERVDEETIALRPAVYLSYLSKNEQEIVEDLISVNGFKVDMVKAEKLKALSDRDKLTSDKIFTILSGEDDKKPKKPADIKLKPKLVTKYFRSDQKPAEIEKIIEEALELYFQNRRGSENDGETD